MTATSLQESDTILRSRLSKVNASNGEEYGPALERNWPTAYTLVLIMMVPCNSALRAKLRSIAIDGGDRPGSSDAQRGHDLSAAIYFNSAVMDLIKPRSWTRWALALLVYKPLTMGRPVLQPPCNRHRPFAMGGF